MSKVTWLAVDDWAAIYVDGKLIGEQGHSLSPWTLIEVFEALGAEVEDLRYEDESEALIERYGMFPEPTLEDDPYGNRSADVQN